jgi:hypothetical protein
LILPPRVTVASATTTRPTIAKSSPVRLAPPVPSLPRRSQQFACFRHFAVVVPGDELSSRD